MSNIGVDIHKDTPTEILHTILLGIVKYYWAQTVWHLEKEKKMALFQIRLGSVATAGLNIPSIQAEYICHYKGGLIGKHFKTLAQVMSFLVFDLVLLRPCLTPGLIRSLRSHRSSTAQLWSRITYSGHSRADIPPLSTTLGLVPTQSLLHLTVYPALT